MNDLYSGNFTDTCGNPAQSVHVTESGKRTPVLL